MLEKIISKLAILGWVILCFIGMIIVTIPVLEGFSDTLSTVSLLKQLIGIGLILVFLFALVKLANHLKFSLWDRSLFTKKGLMLLAIAFAVKYVIGLVAHIWMKQAGIVGTANQVGLMEALDKMPLYMAVHSMFLAPVVEEIIMRGLLMKQFFGRYRLFGLLVSSLIFAALHGPTDGPSWLIYGGSGLLMGSLYLKTDKLVFPVALHMLNNIVATIFR